MEVNADVVQKNYDSILEEIKKYSPYPEKVKIQIVSKYYDEKNHKKLIDAGFTYFGENRAQVYRDKSKEFANYDNLTWDFIGRLQKNKIKYIVNEEKAVNLIHSVDSFELLQAIDEKSKSVNKVMNVLIQINVSKEESKTGIYVEDFENDYEKYFKLSNVKILGFMTMAPIDATNDEINKYFAKMFELKEKYGKIYSSVQELSMGMSQDYLMAIKNGATILRIGRKLNESH